MKHMELKDLIKVFLKLLILNNKINILSIKIKLNRVHNYKEQIYRKVHCNHLCRIKNMKNK